MYDPNQHVLEIQRSNQKASDTVIINRTKKNDLYNSGENEGKDPK